MNVQAIEKTIRHLMRKRNTPGLALAVIRNNAPIYSKGFGLRNLKQRQHMTTDTLIGIGSITKSFVAFIIMQLEEQSKLSVDDSVSDYLKVEPFLSRSQIKVKHLLAHSSGIPAMDAGQDAFTYTFDQFDQLYPTATREEFFAHINDAVDYIIYEPGEHFFYNNDMYTCLVFIIEKCTGVPFHQSLKDNILTPLQMTRSQLTEPLFYADPEDNIMTGYRRQKKEGQWHYLPSDLPIGGYIEGSGGLYTSMNEMLNYAACLLNHGEFNGKQLLTPSSVQTLFNPQIVTPYGRGGKPYYCLGWSKDEATATIPYTVYHHGGGMITSSSYLALIPELDVGISVAENASTGICPIIANAVIAALLDNNINEVVEDLTIEHAVEEIIGQYQSPHNMYSFAVSYKNNVLQVNANIDDGAISFPLVVDNLQALAFKRYSLRADNKNKVQFIRNITTDKVEWVSYDRYLYRREQ